MLTGASGSPQSGFGIQNRRWTRVHAAVATPLRGGFGHLGEKNKSVASITRSDAFILLRCNSGPPVLSGVPRSSELTQQPDLIDRALLHSIDPDRRPGHS